MKIGQRQARGALGAVLAVLLLSAGGNVAHAQTFKAPLPPIDGKGVPAPAAKQSCRQGAFRVAVDVGHTVDVPGAISARGVPEYAFNLELGQEVLQSLIKAGFALSSLLVTDVPPWQGLVQRARIANGMQADLFISLHHDSVPDNLLQTWQYDGKDNHFNDDYPGYAIFISNDNPDRAGSLLFGRTLGAELEARGLQYTPHYTLPLMGHRRRELVDAKTGVYRYDQLIVLRQTHMPAVLLEAGSIVNRQEELQLGSPERRTVTSDAIVGAVEKFCSDRARPVTAKAAVSTR
jgi:N-acetylmuramoyl-L-alanine amidase